MNQDLKILLYIILVSIALLYVLLFMQLLAQKRDYVLQSIAARGYSQPKNIYQEQPFSIPSPSKYQTDFFRKSIEHAEKVLYGKTFVEQYGEADYYGNQLLDTISKLSNDTKKSIVLAMQYTTLEPISARKTEKEYRLMAELEKVPVWFIILREATKKMVPEFTQKENKVTTQDAKIIPLFGKVA